MEDLWYLLALAVFVPVGVRIFMAVVVPVGEAADESSSPIWEILNG